MSGWNSALANLTEGHSEGDNLMPDRAVRGGKSSGLMNVIGRVDGEPFGQHFGTGKEHHWAPFRLPSAGYLSGALRRLSGNAFQP